MDISLLSSLGQINVQNDVGVAMLSKSLDLIETMGDGMQKIMEQSVTPHIGSNIDISI
ncbi:YjfB family protein [Anaerosacchariphilus polymeriproducens]|uniref:Putative motility protein n=1 Tax=Anaerosacchariphilus polymeriproducens TaxID=1812858 RepID=A0A371AT09_9FIRM|nr:YjfB family protein [Anaerosacchariphilus polymeriproducens]RDU22689.1 putative motility protein [Anaerosacchariphilus polymeriproducens]